MSTLRESDNYIVISTLHKIITKIQLQYLTTSKK
jgi:hypothetical protein